MAIGAMLWVGTTLVLADVAWFARRPLTERLRPYVPGGLQRTARGGLLSVDTFREVLGPLASSIGERASRIVGVRDDLATRLARVHSDLDPLALRIHQLAWAGAAFVLGSLAAVAIGAPLTVGCLLVFGSPVLAFLWVEHRVTSESDRWQRRLFLELPIVSEQVGMLLSAGYSLGGALDRIGTRGSGACAADFERVVRRVRQGLAEADALREWADLADVPAVHRLVSILALNRDTGDLGRLISEEARTLRREAHRELSAAIERRAQQVWIPVTVATLLPGTVFLAIPFLQAMHTFSGS